MKKSLIYFLSISIILFSCKKEKLEGEKTRLIGKWKWSYSIKKNGICNPPSWETTLTPSTENNTLTEKYRIVFYDWYQSEQPDYWDDPTYRHFGIMLNNKENNMFGGEVGLDTMEVYGYPFNDDCNGCCGSSGYFIKE